jgi:hypothetical protein
LSFQFLNDQGGIDHSSAAPEVRDTSEWRYVALDIEGRERGAVPGAIPNGIVRDMGIADRSGFDMSRAGGRSPSFRTSEPWLVHNMFYLLATIALEKAVEAQTKD